MLESQSLLLFKKDDLEYIKFPKLEACGTVRHIFSTRHGGVSTGDAATMNLSFNKDTNPENVVKNFEILCSAVEIDTKNLVLSHQTHTNNVRIVTKNDCGTGFCRPSFCDVDGMITNERGVALVTQYADCTPLLFCDPVNKVIANSHSGWRGTAKLIGKVTVEKMVKEFGCDRKNIIAAIGPAICKSCYEVDDKVYDEFIKIDFLDLDAIFLSKSGGKYQLDLTEANRQILINAGIRPENIDISDICTCCNSEDLHSHRATNGKRGNLAAIIELK